MCGLECPSFLEGIFHSRPALYGGSLRCTGAAPVRLQTYYMVITVALESLILTDPIDGAFAHRGPVILIPDLDRVFAMAMPDPIFRQEIITVGIRLFAEGRGVARV